MNFYAGTLLLSLFLASSTLVSSLQNGFTTVVEPRKRDCFYERVDANTTLELEYQVRLVKLVMCKHAGKICSITQLLRTVLFIDLIFKSLAGTLKFADLKHCLLR